MPQHSPAGRAGIPASRRWRACPPCAALLGAFLAGALPGHAALGQQPAPAALPADPELGSISGSVSARDGSPLAGAAVALSAPGFVTRQAITDDHGSYRFDAVPPGAYTLRASTPGFTTVTEPATVEPGQGSSAGALTLPLETAVSSVRVTVTEQELATEEVKEEETQRVFGVIPNFLVSYDWKPAPLSPKQKFELSWRSILDPVSIGITAGIAGVQQADDALPGYGQGAQGYFKRFGANYADLSIGTLLGSAALPILFRQDPRYLVRSTGSVTHRALYAISATVICRGDSGNWQPNYSNILGSLGAGAASNLYYPASDRNGAGLTIENGLIGLAYGAIDNLFEEFLVRKLTPHPPVAVGASPGS